MKICVTCQRNIEFFGTITHFNTFASSHICSLNMTPLPRLFAIAAAWGHGIRWLGSTRFSIERDGRIWCVRKHILVAHFGNKKLIEKLNESPKKHLQKLIPIEFKFVLPLNHRVMDIIIIIIFGLNWNYANRWILIENLTLGKCVLFRELFTHFSFTRQFPSDSGLLSIALFSTDNNL